MAAPKRTRAERESDMIITAELLQRGYSVSYIAEHLSTIRHYSLTRQAVFHDQKALFKRWREKQQEAISVYLEMELGRLAQLEVAYWEEWERSRQDKTTKTTSRTTKKPGSRGRGGDADGRNDSATVKTETMLGDPRYLAGIQKAIDQRCKLLGLFMPEKIAPTTPDGKEAHPGGMLFYIPDNGRDSELNGPGD